MSVGLLARKTSVALLAVGAVGPFTLILLADDHQEREDAGHGREYSESRDEEADRERKEPGNGVASSTLSDPLYSLYKSECSGCHIAYPPALLPAASWRVMMGNLQDHFRENAELDAMTAKQITGFL